MDAAGERLLPAAASCKICSWPQKSWAGPAVIGVRLSVLLPAATAAELATCLSPKNAIGRYVLGGCPQRRQVSSHDTCYNLELFSRAPPSPRYQFCRKQMSCPPSPAEGQWRRLPSLANAFDLPGGDRCASHFCGEPTTRTFSPPGCTPAELVTIPAAAIIASRTLIRLSNDAMHTVL